MKATARKGYDETIVFPRGFTVAVVEHLGDLVMRVELHDSARVERMPLTPHESRQIASLLRNGTELDHIPHRSCDEALDAARKELERVIDCGQDPALGCAEAPGCLRCFGNEVAKTQQERDDAQAREREHVTRAQDVADEMRRERDAAIAERDELRRRLESMPPWPEEGEPLDDEQMRALMLRWSTGPELYQADADALIASLRMARAELDDTRAERDQLRQRLRLTEETLIAEVGGRGPAAAAVDRIRVAETERDRLRTELEALRESARADMYRFDPTWRCDRIAQCITAILRGAKS